MFVLDDLALISYVTEAVLVVKDLACLIYIYMRRKEERREPCQSRSKVRLVNGSLALIPRTESGDVAVHVCVAIDTVIAWSISKSVSSLTCWAIRHGVIGSDCVSMTQCLTAVVGFRRGVSDQKWYTSSCRAIVRLRHSCGISVEIRIEAAHFHQHSQADPILLLLLGFVCVFVIVNMFFLIISLCLERDDLDFCFDKSAIAA